MVTGYWISLLEQEHIVSNGPDGAVTTRWSGISFNLSSRDHKKWSLFRITGKSPKLIKDWTFQWTNHRWIDFYEKCRRAIDAFEILVERVHDIYTNRILSVLVAMQDVHLQVLPPGEYFLIRKIFSIPFPFHTETKTTKCGPLTNSWRKAKMLVGK